MIEHWRRSQSTSPNSPQEASEEGSGGFMLDISDQEENNLRQLKKLRCFQWYVATKTLGRGECFGEAAFGGCRH